MATLGDLVVNLTANTRNFEGRLRSSRGSLKSFVVGATAMAAGATAAVYAFNRLIRAGNEFDRQLQSSLAIMGNVSDELRGDMVNAAKEVARQTKFSAAEAAESYFFLASAGLDAAQSIKAMPKVATFAQAGNFDLALATDLLTDAQSALGLSSKDAAKNMENMTRVSDVLVKANTLANASVQQFSEALTNKAGAALRTVGKSVEEGVAVLAAFADQGVKGADAGNALNIVMRDLQTKALQNSSAFKAMGVTVFDSTGEMVNMASIVGDLEKLLGNMSDAQKKATLLQLGFTDKSISFIQTLLGTSDAISRYQSALEGAGGTTQEIADKQMTDFDRGLNKLKASAESLSILMSGKLGPSIGVAFEGIAKLIDGIAWSVQVIQSMLTGLLSNLALIAGWALKLQPLTNFLADKLLGINSDTLFAITEDLDKLAMEQLPKAASEADELDSSLKSVAGNAPALSALGDAADDVATGLSGADKKLADFAANMQRIDALAGSGGISPIEIKGMREEATRAFSGIGDAIAATKLQLREMKGEITSTDIELAGFADKFATEDAQKELRALRNEMDALRTGKEEREALERESQSIFEQTRTPLEKFNAEAARLEELRKKGLSGGGISDETFGRAIQQAMERAKREAGITDKESKLGPKPTITAAVKGSSEAFEIIQANINKQRETVSEKQLAEEKMQNDTLVGIHETMKEISNKTTQPATRGFRR